MEGTGTAAVAPQPLAQTKLEGRDSRTLNFMTMEKQTRCIPAASSGAYRPSGSLSAAKWPSRYFDVSCVRRRKATKGAKGHFNQNLWVIKAALTSPLYPRQEVQQSRCEFDYKLEKRDFPSAPPPPGGRPRNCSAIENNGAFLVSLHFNLPPPPMLRNIHRLPRAACACLRRSAFWCNYLHVLVQNPSVTSQALHIDQVSA